MRKSIKIWLIVAFALILSGAGVFTAMLAQCNWDFTKLSTTEYKSETYTSDSPITDISINSTTADITFCFTDTDSTTVVCYEMEKVPHNVRFDNGKLIIEEDDQRKWYEYIGINFDTPRITVYLPKNEYGTLDINVCTGDVTIPADFTFENVSIMATTCDVALGASVNGTLTVKTTTGDVRITNAEFGSVALLTTTGDMDLTNVKTKIIYSSGSTGDITLNHVIAEESLNISRCTGDVKLNGSDAPSICIQLTTGDVTGSLLTGKIFSVETSTGKISVPESTPNGVCVISTSTGNIHISISEN